MADLIKIEGFPLFPIIGVHCATMFCPQCHAEYRPGFTHCTDCDVDLVDTLPSSRGDGGAWETATWERAAQLRTYDAQLWRGTDPHFYLSLIAALRSKDTACLGRPTTLPVPGSSTNEELESSAQPEFEILVNQKSMPVAMRVLEFTKEDYGKEWPVAGPDKDEEGDTAVTPVAVCPLCSAEFPAGTSLCTNCGVNLLPEADASSLENSPRFLSDLRHPVFFKMLTGALRAENIPFNNANFYYYDRILGFSRNVPSHRVMVLDSDFERASKVLARVLLRWEFEPSAGLRWVREIPQTYRSSRVVERGWLPEELDVPAWSGRNLSTLEFVAEVLQEHEIAYRIVDKEQQSGTVFVHSEDQDDANRIVREILAVEPPE